MNYLATGVPEMTIIPGQCGRGGERLGMEPAKRLWFGWLRLERALAACLPEPGWFGGQSISWRARDDQRGGWFFPVNIMYRSSRSRGRRAAGYRCSRSWRKKD